MSSINSQTRISMTSAQLIFWDFDGVIKESVYVKTQAFTEVFRPYGSDVANRVRQHHESNGGVSRFEKIPLYLDWAGVDSSTKRVQKVCEKFSAAVVQSVIVSPWVPGVLDYFREHSSKQYFVVVTATPQEEIKHILTELKISQHFKEVHGAPVDKSIAIREVLLRLQCDSCKAIMIGDSASDLRAAEANAVPFVLRRTPLNNSLQSNYSGLMLNDFC